MQNNELIRDLFINFSDHPLIKGIPWAYKNPKEKFIEWSFKTQSYINFEKGISNSVQENLNNKRYTGSTQKRMQNFVQSKASSLKAFSKILSPFLEETQKVNITDSQNILSYQDLIFRDWVWGQDEVEQYYDTLSHLLTENVENILVLGAGACGLSYKISENTKANIIACDINPYLILSSQKIINNEELKLWEFNDFPKELEQYSIKHKIEKRPKRENHFQVFTDFKEMPFKKNSFDLIISNWFFDILDIELEQSLKHSNTYLKENGTLHFLGPSNFHKNQPSKQLTSFEIIERFESNYNTVTPKSMECSYLNNPSNTQSRIESLLCIEAKSPIASETYKEKEDYEVKVDQKLLGYKQKIDIFNRILKYIDKNISYEELALKLQSEFGFTSEESSYYAKSFTNKILSEL